MIEVIFLSSAVFFSVHGPETCEYTYERGQVYSEGVCTKAPLCRAFQEIVESTYTAKSIKCAEEWEEFFEVASSECHLLKVTGLYFCRGDDQKTRPDCVSPKKIITSRVLVGLCDDSVVRWVKAGKREGE